MFDFLVSALSDSVRASFGSSLCDSESGGCLHPIGLPSSVYNQSDDYLHPVVSSLERDTAAHLT